jgi:hypothetical protein
MAVRGSQLWLPMAIAATFVGCGPTPQELRTAEQSSEFIGDIARGGKGGDWKLADGAVADATRAWAVRGTIHDLGAKLRDKGADWACDAAHKVERAGKVIDGIYLELKPEDRNAIIASAEKSGADPSEVDSLIDEALRLTDSELVKTITVACQL